MLGSNDLNRSKTFYDAIMATLGYAEGKLDSNGRLGYISENGRFILTRPLDGKPACCANGGTIGFSCKSKDALFAWHKAGSSHGGTAVENPPGPRETSFGKLWLAYLRDPDGNKLCATYVGA